MFATVFTVDSLVTLRLNLTLPEELSQSLNFTWSMTDNEILQVESELNSPSSGMVVLMATIQSKLDSIRSNLSLKTEHPLNMINSYKLIFDMSEQFSVDKSLFTDRKFYDYRWHLLKSFIEIQNAPYSLFIKGMNRRFIELAYGTIYHIGYVLFWRFSCVIYIF